MARKREVTRTITGTKAQVLVVDVNTGATEVREVLLSVKLEDAGKILKAIEKLYAEDEPNVKAVNVSSFEHIEKLYAMDEQKFIELAEERAPRGTEA
jgi:hypothetical protein